SLEEQVCNGSQILYEVAYAQMRANVLNFKRILQECTWCRRLCAGFGVIRL
uniref:Uncharacterized protein n=1 Tax=Cannabis sativa TaxID=3483 RepID=A0A803Q216_CANSA